MQKHTLTLLFVFVFLGINTNAQKNTDSVRAGIYIKSIYDINSSAFSYDVDLWMWYYYSNDSLKPLQTVEIANAKRYDYTNTSLVKKKGTNWASQDCKATINQNWDLQNYPFDHQKLELVIEESDKDARNLILLSDKNKLEYNSDINIKGWKIDSTSIANGLTHYNSDFGDQSLKGESYYSKIHYTIFLSRLSWGLFFKLFTGCYVAFLVSFLVFYIKPIHVDPRFGLSIGGLFAAVGNKYVVDSNIPSSITFTLIDKIHGLSFVYILLTILLSIISLRIFEKDKIVKQMRFDKYSALLVFISYLLFNIIIITKAL